MEENIKKRGKILVALGMLSLLALVIGATYAYFSVTTINNFGTTIINATAGDIGAVTFNGNAAQLNLNLTAVDMARGSTDIYYYATADGTPVVTYNRIALGVVSVSPSTDANTYDCSFEYEITHTGTRDMYDIFNSQTNNVYDYTNRSSAQISLNLSGGVLIDFYNPWPSYGGNANRVQGNIQVSVASPKTIYASLSFLNARDIDQSYLAGSDISISVSIVSNSISCHIHDNNSGSNWAESSVSDPGMGMEPGSL